MAKELTHFIGGKHVKGTSGRFTDAYQPMTGEVISRVPLASKAEVAEVRACPPSPEESAHLVVVAHGGPLRVLAGHLLGLPPERWIGLDFGCGQVTRIDVESWGTVLKWFNR